MTPHPITPDQAMIFAIFATLFVLLVWGRWRYDLVAFGALVLAAMLGLVPSEEVFSGFGHSAVAIIALVLIISRGLIGSGAIEKLASLLLDSKRPLSLHIAIMAVFGAGLSAIINNVAALAILMPLDLDTAAKAKRAASKSLMPLSFATILGGMVTLIGTPPNIVIAQYRQDVTGTPFGMFDFTPVGLTVALAGIAFVTLVGWRLLPERSGAHEQGAEVEMGRYIAELVVGEAALEEGMVVRDLYPLANEHDLHILGLVRNGKRFLDRVRLLTLRAGDVLLLLGTPANTAAAVAWLGALPLEGRETPVVQRSKARLSIGIFLAAIGLAVLGWVPLSVALAGAVIGFVSVGLVSGREVYDTIEWKVIVLLASLIPLAEAFEKSGGAELIAAQILSVTQGFPAWVSLAVLMVVTMTLSDFLNNVATTLIAAPIATGLAAATSTNADPWLMAVAVAASCAFLTPIGHKNNTIILGPGGYRFGDYWRMGLLLEALVLAVGLPMILTVWPL